MSYREPLSGASIAISVSESADLGVLGLSSSHLRDAAEVIARHLLALGARLLYGGDLRSGGFSDVLFELVARYNRDADEGDLSAPVTSYLAWPVHSKVQDQEITARANDLKGVADLVLLDLDGEPVSLSERNVRGTNDLTADWAKGLTSMRRVMQSVASARILIGGQTEGFMGAIPGIAEEALIALESAKPVYILGGFGGCARDVSVLLGVLESPISSDWPGQDRFASYSRASLNNGLSAQECMELGRTPHIEQAMTLVLRGMIRAIGTASAGEPIR